MVSLVNFKTVGEDQMHRQMELASLHQRGSSGNNNNNRTPMQQIVAEDRDNNNDNWHQSNQTIKTTTMPSQRESSLVMATNETQDMSASSCQQQQHKSTSITMPNNSAKPPSSHQPQQQQQQKLKLQMAPSSASTNFTVTWRNLRFAIEPKWHEKLAGGSSRLGRLANRLANNKPPPPSATGQHQQADSEPQPAAMIGGAIANETPDDQTLAAIADNQTATPTACDALAPTTTSRVVLDCLDGSFRSGELTAILGPSGAGKTTLLDCLTGHRKHGLSGSIRISLNSPEGRPQPTSTANGTCQSQSANMNNKKKKNLKTTTNYTDHDNNEQLANCNVTTDNCCCRRLASASTCGGNKSISLQTTTHPAPQPITGDNLKVSIIPQNDHLMGHLTVYETLSYASKMKNCFYKTFDHKLNIKRVAQQLGLVSCLGTRVNKLSGGQYKRVSIAQELLSSPDILILDEPTSGLDAMTCYQTVQVLKKLTECRPELHLDPNESVQSKQIAVILTIHQPNSDVFQQFNNVYVVAQGGKCIYEGPPSGIEPMINQIGIHLPNNYYNPATMIVEVAAGKFGMEAVRKLNSMQRQQYLDLPGATTASLINANNNQQQQQQQQRGADEQNSTGDSAVDCPSSSSSFSSSSAASSNDEADDDYHHHRHHEAKLASCKSSRVDGKCDCNLLPFEISKNNAPTKNIGGVGLINKGFVCGDDALLDSIKMSNNNIKLDNMLVPADCLSKDANEQSNLCNSHQSPACQQRKRRWRVRRRTCQQGGSQQQNQVDHQMIHVDDEKHDNKLMVANCGGDGGGDNNNDHNPREKRLKLNSLKAGQKFPFWRHTYLHFHRSWLSIVRDPMLCSMQLALHIIVPVMVSLVYGTRVGVPNACPRAGPVDIMAYSLEPTDTALQLQEDLRTTLENIGYIFFKLYGIIFAAMTVTVLTFPLDMHVLVKEFRNGWYGLSSYFLGRTLADIPFQLTLPLLAMLLSYYATGQPSSYLQWRFLSITAILILSSLIAQSQGLLFGAILMDRMKAAVFVAPAATTPIILFAGFLVRNQSIPRYLRPLSNLSYLRYAIEACLISRYGFNQCECDPAIFNQTVPELPPIARSMLDYWLSSFKPPAHGSLANDTDSTMLETTMSSDTIDATSGPKPDLFTKLIDSLAKANSFGRNITSCDQVVPYPMIDYDLKDAQLLNCFAILLGMLLFTRLLTFFIVCFKVKRKV